MQTHIRLHHMGVRIVHSDLREEFWILRARQAIKVLYTCLPCKIARNPFGQEREAPMPADSHCLRSFQVTGIDFAGLNVKRKPPLRKCYIALFTCATVRAVHVELCSDLTTDTFLLAFQRLDAADYRIQYTPTTRRRSTRRTGSSLSCGKPLQPLKPIASLPSMASHGNSSLPGRLGGENGGKE